MHTQTVEELNDAFRQTLLGGRVAITHGVVDALGADGCEKLMDRIINYEGFVIDNERYDEHNFGIVFMSGKTFIWKIDYYSTDMENTSYDPTDTDVTQRVMTIMLSTEYAQ
jgi:hypothetical protein